VSAGKGHGFLDAFGRFQALYNYGTIHRVADAVFGTRSASETISADLRRSGVS
jgi:hypothetical protein